MSPTKEKRAFRLDGAKLKELPGSDAVGANLVRLGARPEVVRVVAPDLVVKSPDGKLTLVEVKQHRIRRR